MVWLLTELLSAPGWCTMEAPVWLTRVRLVAVPVPLAAMAEMVLELVVLAPLLMLMTPPYWLVRVEESAVEVVASWR